MRLTQADRSEILRYIGYSGQKIDENLAQRIADAIAKTNRAADPKLTAVLYTCREDGSWPEALTFLTGDDIQRHLAGCSRILLMGATLGAGVAAMLARNLVLHRRYLPGLSLEVRLPDPHIVARHWVLHPRCDGHDTHVRMAL